MNGLHYGRIVPVGVSRYEIGKMEAGLPYGCASVLTPDFFCTIERHTQAAGGDRGDP